jgi:hypothetical protein
MSAEEGEEERRGWIALERQRRPVSTATHRQQLYYSTSKYVRSGSGSDSTGSKRGVQL